MGSSKQKMLMGYYTGTVTHLKADENLLRLRKSLIRHTHVNSVVNVPNLHLCLVRFLMRYNSIMSKRLTRLGWGMY